MASLSPSLTNLSHLLQMAYVSPFMTSSTNEVTSFECKFLGNIMFNHLPPSDHVRQTKPIYIIRFKRIEQGQLLYPKICPLILSRFPLTRFLELHTGLGFCFAQDISLHWWPEIRVWVCTRIFRLSMLNVTFMLHIGLLSLLIPSFKPWIKLFAQSIGQLT